MITARPHALVSSDVTRNKFTTYSGLIYTTQKLRSSSWSLLVASLLDTITHARCSLLTIFTDILAHLRFKRIVNVFA